MSRISYRTVEEAWEHVNRIFPTDYAKDEESTKNAGYPIYRSTAEGYWWNWISDLGNCLEVNLMDGTTIRINIEKQEEEIDEREVEEAVLRMRSAKQLGSRIEPMFGEEPTIKMTFCVDGDLGTAEEKTVYDGIRKGENWLSNDMVEAYCKNRNIPWKTISVIKTVHYAHSTRRNGHYIIEALITI